MSFPSEPRAFDTMLGVPSNRGAWQEAFGSLVRDAGSGGLAHPAGYMFKDLPEVDGEEPFDAFMISEMDRWGVESGLLPVTFAADDLGRDAVQKHPGRLHGSFAVDPKNGMDELRALERAVAVLGVRAAG